MRDLKELVKLCEQLNEKDLKTSVDEEEILEKKEEEEDSLPWMKTKSKKAKKPQHHSSPIKSNPREKEYNCHECFYQGTKQMELDKHIKLKHTKDKKEMES